MSVPRLFLFASSLFVVSSLATAAPWGVSEDESEIEFAYNWAGTPAGGNFEKFKATIEFDRAALESSAVSVEIDLASVSAAYSQVATELVKAEWFDVENHPTALFESSDFAAREDGSFEARGTLTMKGVTHPSTLSFRFDSYGPLEGQADTLRAVMDGETTISRTAYGIGQGSWSDTGTLADEVTVTVKITAEKSIAP